MLLLVETGRGPEMSKATLSMGAPTLQVCIGARSFRWGLLREAHRSHFLHHSLTSWLHLYQYYLCFTLFTVFATPRCPVVLVSSKCCNTSLLRLSGTMSCHLMVSPAMDSQGLLNTPSRTILTSRWSHWLQ